MQKLTIGLLGAATLLLTTAMPAQADLRDAGAAGAAPAAVSDEERAPGRVINKWLAQDRINFRAMGEELARIGVTDVRISNPAFGIENASPRQADLTYTKYVRAQVGVTSDDQNVIFDVPVNAFTITTVAYNFVYTGGNSDNIEAHWNFRDDYVNGSAPDDAVGIALESYNFGCYSTINTWKESYTWNNSHQTSDDAIWLESLTPTAAVWRIRDRVSGFQLNVDHGFTAISLRRYNAEENPPSCGSDRSQRIDASSYFEHNQDGNGSWSASIGWGLFQLNYTGSAGDRLQKAGGIASIRF
ncbi:hypothetical protein ACQPYA_18585 [Micromonospora sp. CA-263727]|uniref:hypothetical protein n=1 Tax=Micromonospora sp. CA-263727 TaxID=3239967 RepID=UPI003D93F87D